MSDSACQESVGARGKPCGQRPATPDPAKGGDRCERHHSDRTGVGPLSATDQAKYLSIAGAWENMDSVARDALRSKWPEVVARIESERATPAPANGDAEGPPAPATGSPVPNPHDPVYVYALALAEAEDAKLRATAATARAGNYEDAVRERLADGPVAIGLPELGLVVTVFLEPRADSAPEVRTLVAKAGGGL